MNPIQGIMLCVEQYAMCQGHEQFVCIECASEMYRMCNIMMNTVYTECVWSVYNLYIDSVSAQCRVCTTPMKWSECYLLEVFDSIEVESLLLDQVQVFIIQLVPPQLLLLLLTLNLKYPTRPALTDTNQFIRATIDIFKTGICGYKLKNLKIFINNLQCCTQNLIM